jgi:hypothetical protein
MSEDVSDPSVMAKMEKTYPWDSLPYSINILLHIGILPTGWKVEIPISRVRFPPQSGIDCHATTQDTNTTC